MSSKLTIILSVVLITLVACPTVHTDQRHEVKHPAYRFLPNRPLLAGKRIVGGFVINISQAPYQISLQYNNQHHCGGTILNKKWILTAAHCIDQHAEKNPLVRVGSSEHASGGSILHLARIVLHPEYSARTNNYDIALLELQEELIFSNKVLPMALPEQDEQIEDGQKGIVTGWGMTLSEADSNAFLRATNVPVVNQEECNKAYHSYGGITEQMFCAGFKQGGTGPCRKDSGGPFIAEGVGGVRLIGVVSWSHECAMAGYPGVYARVPSVRNWIHEISGI